jgi:hypothetical protein
MIRNMVMIELKAGADLGEVAEIKAGFRALDAPSV